MCYIVKEVVFNAVMETDFSKDDIIKLKNQAENYFITKWLDSSGEAELYFVDSSGNEYILSKGSTDNAIIEADEIRMKGYPDFVFEKWEDRQKRLITWYKQINP